MTSDLKKINDLCRYSLSFVFLYHGLVPKIIALSPTEVAIITAHNSDIPVNVFSAGAGILEIALSLVIAFYKSSITAVYVAVFALIALFIDVAIVAPELLIDAFNPVSTNIASLALCYVIILSQSQTVKFS